MRLIGRCLARLFGRQVIVCKRTSDSEWWYTSIRIDPFGERCAYRYDFNQIGHIALNDDRTGYYCGHITWKEI